MADTEQWGEVVGFEGLYEVSNTGRVRRIGQANGAHLGRVLRLSPHPCGYFAVNLWSENRGHSALVHRIVAEAFIGAIPQGYEVNHRNGNKRDNRVCNLEIVTRQQNIDHAMQTGLIDNAGERNPMAKLTAEKASEIKARYIPGECGYKRLAAEYGVTWEAIRNIVKRGAWACVE